MRPTKIDAHVHDGPGLRRVRLAVFWGTWALTLALLLGSSHWALWEARARDAMSAWLMHSEEPADIVLVDISDASIAQLGGWPLDRNVIADLLEVLVSDLGARAVALDMVFPESRPGTGDARLASLVRHAPVVTSQVFDLQGSGQTVRVGQAAGNRPPTQLFAAWPSLPSSNYVANFSALSDANCVGHISIQPDADGVTRRLVTTVQGPQGPVLTLSAALLACVSWTPPASLGWGPQLARWDAWGAPDAHWRLPFEHPWSSFRAVDVLDVLQRPDQVGSLRGHFVLVGSSAVGLGDVLATPLSTTTPGLLVHAQALSHMLQHGVPPALGRPIGLSLVLSLVSALALWWLWLRRPAMSWALAGALCMAWGLVLLPWAFAQQWYPWVLLYPATLLAPLVTSSALELKVAREVKRRALAALAHYVSPAVLKELLARGLRAQLEPQFREITVMAVDMKNYTQTINQLSLKDASAFTRAFLSLITEPVMAHQGTLDRYNGDGLIAFWGAPLAREDHANAALACAEAMLQAVKTWQPPAELAAMGPTGVRIGIESGAALVGDMGSASRSAYTAVGDCINTAARLQELAKRFDVDILIGQGTQQRQGQGLRHVAAVNIRGLRDNSQVFTLEA